MKRNTQFGWAILFASLAFCSVSHAQKMYRCGSVYQDRPCEGAQVGKEVRNFGGSSTPAATSDGADAECKQRGIDSQKIVWSREAGASAEKLMADVSAKRLSYAKAAAEKNLIADVYQKRGSAPEVRAAIEADCVAEKKQAELAAALSAAAAKLQGNQQDKPRAPAGNAAGNSTGNAATQSSASDTKAAYEKQREDAKARDAVERKKALCIRLNEQVEYIQRSQRNGGSAATMESLNQRRRDVDVERSSEGCR